MMGKRIDLTNVDHGWPTESTDHLWGPWMTRNRTTCYRTCVHPTCSAVEELKAPSA